MKDLIRRVINEMVKDGKVICDNCGWSWDIADGGDDTYSCHKCGHDNIPKSQSNLDRLMNQFKSQFPDNLKSKIPMIRKFVFDYIKDNLVFDQMIWEFGTDKNPDWVHVSYESTGKQRKQILKAVKSGGKTSYVPYK
jgi:ribosomal protein S27AE